MTAEEMYRAAPGVRRRRKHHYVLSAAGGLPAERGAAGKLKKNEEQLTLTFGADRRHMATLSLSKSRVS